MGPNAKHRGMGLRVTLWPPLQDTQQRAQRKDYSGRESVWPAGPLPSLRSVCGGRGATAEARGQQVPPGGGGGY